MTHSLEGGQVTEPMYAFRWLPSHLPAQARMAGLMGRWLRRGLFVAGLGLALWLAGTAAASADDSLPEHGLGASLDAPGGLAEVGPGVPLKFAAPAPRPTIGRGHSGAAAPIAGALDRPASTVLTPTADTAVETVRSTVGRTARQVHAATEALPAAVAAVPVHLAAVPVHLGAVPVDLAAVPVDLGAVPVEVS